MKFWSSYKIPIIISLFTFFMLTMVHIKVENQMLALDRFIEYGGWIEIFIISCYAFFIGNKMKDPAQSTKWRQISWLIFTIVFFSQLILGIFVNELFLLSGKLHIPVPVMILSGPIFRGHIGFMTILLLSTILLTGPAWCSQLCYFGAIDNVIAGKKNKQRNKIKHLMKFKQSFILLVIVGTILIRYFAVDIKIATVFGIGFGLAGIALMFILSSGKGTMMHCIAYCPIGTIVNYAKHINPFRMKIDEACHVCMACTSKCKYNALTFEDLQRKKVGITCTNCGDCVSSCKEEFIQYKFFKMSPKQSRDLYIILTVSLHAIFLALGRI